MLIRHPAGAPILSFAWWFVATRNRHQLTATLSHHGRASVECDVRDEEEGGAKLPPYHGEAVERIRTQLYMGKLAGTNKPAGPPLDHSDRTWLACAKRGGVRGRRRTAAS